MNYTSPDKDLKTYTCPHCNTLSIMDITYHAFNKDHYSLLDTTHGVKNAVTIHRCECCGNKIIWVDESYVYPDVIVEQANSDMPNSVKELYDEAGMIYTKSPRAACALLRLAVDRLCHELGETDRDINKNIGALVEKGLSKTVQQALDVVRVVGNKAVHPGQIAFDVDDSSTAIMLMKLINIIVTRMISEPKDIDYLYNKLPESVKEAIEKRNQ